MKTFNISQAKKLLTKLIKQAHDGEPFIIAKAGRLLQRF